MTNMCGSVLCEGPFLHGCNLLILATLGGCAAQAESDSRIPRYQDLGEPSHQEVCIGVVEVGPLNGQVLLNEYTEAYQVVVRLSGAAQQLLSVRGERFRFMLQDNAGRQLQVLWQTPGGIVPWGGNDRGGSAQVSCVFRRAVSRSALKDAIVTVDGRAYRFRLPER